MSAIDRIRERLAGYPQVSYQVENRTITIDPASPEGFSVWLTEAGDELVVGFEGWHEHFTSEEDALNCLAFGLGDQCRLRIDYCGDFPYRWTAEARAGTGWQADSTTGVFFAPFWRGKRTTYHQNHLIPANGPRAGVRPGGMP